MKKKYFKVIMYLENDKGDFDKYASFEGQSTFDSIKKLIKLYEKFLKMDENSKDLTPTREG